MTTRKNNARKNETVTLADSVKSFSNDKVEAMREAIAESFKRRDAFEAANNVATEGKSSSYAREKNNMLGASVAVARLFLALNVEPAQVIERKINDSSMFNAKALKKIREIALFVNGARSLAQVERVVRAFIACAILATDKGVEVITNKVNVHFLNSSDISARLNDNDLLEALNDLRHTAMTSGAQTQSSQSRCVLEVLGCGEIVTVERARDAIKLNAQHALIEHMREALLK